MDVVDVLVSITLIIANVVVRKFGKWSLMMLYEFWVRRTSREYWVVFELKTLNWLVFRDRGEALKSARLNKSDLFVYWWTSKDGWVSRTDLEYMELI